MAAEWMRRMREAFAERQQPEQSDSPYFRAMTSAQVECRKAITSGDVQAATFWTEEVDVLLAMGAEGFRTLRQGVEPSDFMADATEEAEADAEADNVLTIEFDDDGQPWCWAPDDWTDARVLGVLRQCVSNYEDTSEDHL